MTKEASQRLPFKLSPGNDRLITLDEAVPLQNPH